MEFNACLSGFTVRSELVFIIEHLPSWPLTLTSLDLWRVYKKFVYLIQSVEFKNIPEFYSTLEGQ